MNHFVLARKFQALSALHILQKVKNIKRQKHSAGLRSNSVIDKGRNQEIFYNVMCFFIYVFLCSICNVKLKPNTCAL